MEQMKTGRLQDLYLKIGDRLFSLDDTSVFKRDVVYTVNEQLLSYKGKTNARFFKVNS